MRGTRHPRKTYATSQAGARQFGGGIKRSRICQRRAHHVRLAPNATPNGRIRIPVRNMMGGVTYMPVDAAVAPTPPGPSELVGYAGYGSGGYGIGGYGRGPDAARPREEADPSAGASVSQC